VSERYDPTGFWERAQRPTIPLQYDWVLDRWVAAQDRTPKAKADVLREVALERARQEQLWGRQDHAPVHWLKILGEEYGEACEAAPWSMEGGPEPVTAYRTELIQVAAVAVAAVEALDRQGKA